MISFGDYENCAADPESLSLIQFYAVLPDALEINVHNHIKYSYGNRFCTIYIFFSLVVSSVCHSRVRFISHNLNLCFSIPK